MRAVLFVLVLAFTAVVAMPTPAAAQTQFIYGLCNVKKYGNGTDYAADVDAVIDRLSATVATEGGFAADRAGHVNGIAQCRADVSAADCQLCASAVASTIRSSCPNAVGARLQLEHCFLRYENYAFAGQLDTTYAGGLINVNNNTDIAGFNATLARLMSGLTPRAAAATPTRFASAAAPTANRNVTLYGIQWCVRSLSSRDCATCLNQAVQQMYGCCSVHTGAQVYLGSCALRYEIYPFVVRS